MIEYRTKDHPEANGRRPQPGERQYHCTFPLENGDFVRVFMGQEGFDNHTQLLMEMLAELPCRDDGSVPK